MRPGAFASAARTLRDHLCLPSIENEALAGPKFSDAQPRHLAGFTVVDFAAQVRSMTGQESYTARQAYDLRKRLRESPHQHASPVLGPGHQNALSRRIDNICRSEIG
jgi:hypothetical protein